MKGFQMFIFLGVFFSLYTVANYFIFIRGWQALHNFAPKPVLVLYIAGFLVFSLTYFLMRFTSAIIPIKVADFLAFFGSMWFAAMLYFLLFMLLFDVIRLFTGGFLHLPEIITANWAIVKAGTLVFVIAVVLVLIIVGNRNANNLIVKEVVIDVE